MGHVQMQVILEGTYILGLCSASLGYLVDRHRASVCFQSEFLKVKIPSRDYRQVVREIRWVKFHSSV